MASRVMHLAISERVAKNFSLDVDGFNLCEVNRCGL